jgi:O-antigen/teichoic acid export membrane protein
MKTSNKRIAKNTIMLYIRMLFVMFVSLYTSRIILDVLGIDDYGIFNVVGGVVAMFGFLNASMVVAVQRFLSFEIGKDNLEQQQKIFNISLIVHIVIALIVFILAETIGLWVVKTQLTIPPDRLNAAIWVYHFAVLSTMLTIIQVPYNAAIISNEKMTIYAYIGILEVVLRLVIVYILLIGTIDKLVLYGGLTFCVSAVIMLITIIYCFKKISGIRLGFLWDKQLFKKLMSFAGWSILGESAWVFALQGVNIVLNIFFNPAINTARGISYQVTGAISRFSANFQTAVNPQIIKTYAVEDFASMNSLIFRGTRFSYYVLFLMALPIFLEIEQILGLWLVEVPPYTAIFCRLVIINALIDVLSNLLTTAVRASGKIAKYQLIVSLLLVSNFPISYLILKLGGEPQSTLYVYGIIAIILLTVRLILVNKMISFPIKGFLQKVIFPIFIVTITSSILPYAYYLLANESILRLMLTVLISVVCVGASAFFLGMEKGERLTIYNGIKHKLRIGK